jgi:hypothetical protein
LTILATLNNTEPAGSNITDKEPASAGIPRAAASPGNDDHAANRRAHITGGDHEPIAQRGRDDEH